MDAANETVEQAKLRAKEFNAQGLANTAWALARLIMLHEKLLRAYAAHAERRASVFTVMGVRNEELAGHTAWACAKLTFGVPI